MQKDRKLSSFLVTGRKGGGKTIFAFANICKNFKKHYGQQDQTEQMTADEWEHLLDSMGTNAPINRYWEMLSKAPAGVRSQKVLVQHIQNLMSA